MSIFLFKKKKILKSIFSQFLLNIKHKLLHIWNLQKIYMLNNIYFLYINDFHKSAQFSYFFFKLRFYETNLRLLFFCFFTCTIKNQSGITKWPTVEPKQDQQQVRHEWSIGVVLLLLIENRYQHRWSKNTKQKIPRFCVFCLHPYAWLERYDCHCLFGTNILNLLNNKPIFF